MLVDDVIIRVEAGRGGNGAATFRRNAQTAKGGPDGGNGGNGGNIYAIASPHVTDLRQFRFRKIIKGEHGTDGKRSNLFGKNAEHITIELPLGTHVTDETTGISKEIRDTETSVLLARGGIGGRGNVEFKSATNQTPTFAEKGGKGEEKTLHLVLRLIAEIGLIGLPNAGKSSLLTTLTNSKAKIGAYPFTTIEPNIGMFGTHPIADIPGLIEGASEGKGLGITFLKHIEKTKVLLHCIDVSSEDPKTAYETVRNEFETYSNGLVSKPEVIVLTKVDSVDSETLKKHTSYFESLGKSVYHVSVYDTELINQFRLSLENLLSTAS